MLLDWSRSSTLSPPVGGGAVVFLAGLSGGSVPPPAMIAGLVSVRRLTPAPIQATLTDGVLLASGTWPTWLTRLVAAVNAAPGVIVTSTLTGQTAAIPLMALATGTVTGGAYQIQAYLQVTQAATTSSSATLTLGWTTNGIAQTSTAAPVTGNTPATSQTTSLFVLADQGSVFSYAVAYASVGATPLQYSLTLKVTGTP